MFKNVSVPHMPICVLAEFNPDAWCHFSPVGKYLLPGLCITGNAMGGTSFYRLHSLTQNWSYKQKQCQKNISSFFLYKCSSMDTKLILQTETIPEENLIKIFTTVLQWISLKIYYPKFILEIIFCQMGGKKSLSVTSDEILKIIWSWGHWKREYVWIVMGLSVPPVISSGLCYWICKG